MRINLFLFVSLFLTSCSNPDKADKDTNENSSEIVSSTVETDSTKSIQQADSKPQIKKEDWLTPAYLSADFNNDSQEDSAFAVIIDGKKGILIKHGGKDEEFLIGAGKSFGNGGDDFHWVDTWELVKEPTTHQTTFTEDGDVKGLEEVELESTAFYIGNNELGGATIAWKNGEYRWIHQAD